MHAHSNRLLRPNYFLGASTTSLLIVVLVAFMAHINSHLATHLFPKASRPMSNLIVLTIYPTLVSSKFYFRKVGNHDLLTSLYWYSLRYQLWQNRPNYSSLSAQVAPLKAATHLNRNNPSVPRI
jgi:hypothetical protein